MTTNHAPRRPRAARALAALAALTLLGTAACNDFLAGGELSDDPNRPTIATNRQLFVGVQTNIWSQYTSDPARIVNLWTQQFEGGQSQYISAYTYQVNENTTNGFHRSLYAGGGLKDVRQLQDNAREQGDTLFLGIAQIQEAMLVGHAADLFGDLVYSEALNGATDAALDPQLEIYDALQVLLDDAIENLESYTNTATNLGPAASDLVYQGDAEKWVRLAHTLKARLYLHTAEVRPAAYELAYQQSKLGILDPADDYEAIFSGNAGESNFWYQFTLEQRFGYIIPNPQFVELLEDRNDPRLEFFFDVTGDLCGDPFFCLGGTGEGDAQPSDPGYDQPIVTAAENHLIWAETAYRTSRPGEALTHLNEAREIAELPAVGGLSGEALLREILTEKYIALFQNIEAFNDYKRTCFPNVEPTVEGLKIPARLLYDTQERLTNANVPAPQEQPTRNANDPPNATADATGGQACRGQ